MLGRLYLNIYFIFDLCTTLTCETRSELSCKTFVLTFQMLEDLTVLQMNGLELLTRLRGQEKFTHHYESKFLQQVGLLRCRCFFQYNDALFLVQHTLELQIKTTLVKWRKMRIT